MHLKNFIIFLAILCNFEPLSFFYFVLMEDANKYIQQAGAELGQAQFQLS